MGWWKRRLPKKRWKRVCLYLFSTLLMVLAADMLLVQYWRRIEIGYDTTRIASPLNSHGMPDYVAAMEKLYGEAVPNESNAAPLLFRLIGTERIPPELREKVMPSLGLPTAPLEQGFVPFSSWQHQQQPTSQPAGVDDKALEAKLDAEEDAVLKHPWTRQAKPAVAAWLETQQPAIVRACAAADRPAFFIPFPARIENTSEFVNTALQLRQPVWGGCRASGTLLSIDAMRCAGEHDGAAFRRDILAQMKLARLVAPGPILMDRLMGYAIDGFACRTLGESAEEAGFLSGPEARQLLSEMQKLPPLASMASAMDTGERWMMLDTYCDASLFGAGHLFQRWMPVNEHHPVATTMMSLFDALHLDAAMRDSNHFYDQLIATAQAPTFPQGQRARETLEADQERAAQNLLKNLANPAKLLTAIAIPSLSMTFKVEATTRMEEQLAQVTLALAIYRAEHGRYPETLAALAPGILPVVPMDLFSDGPLIYHTTPTGCVLYSMGPNGKDDGGVDRAQSKNGNYDLVVRMGD